MATCKSGPSKLVAELHQWLGNVVECDIPLESVHCISVMLEIDTGMATVNGRRFHYHVVKEMAISFAYIVRRWARIAKSAEITKASISVPYGDIATIQANCFALTPGSRGHKLVLGQGEYRVHPE